MIYLGSYTAGSTVYTMFNTQDTDLAPIALAGTPVVQVYKDASTTEDNSGITLSVDYDLRVGLNHVAIDTSADATFYAAGSEFFVVITTGTVDAISVVGKCVAHFSLTS